MVGVNVQDNEEDALAFAHEFRPTYPELRSVGDSLSEDFGSTGVPENFLFNPRGRLAAFWPARSTTRSSKNRRCR